MFGSLKPASVSCMVSTPVNGRAATTSSAHGKGQLKPPSGYAACAARMWKSEGGIA